ncbi:hypothetical protein SAMN05216420_10939 [Nitrosospira sp. Nl5]|nr:hypothetical protein SAMN05216420_10939 [Nitrosospira sp. Nl5]
MKTGLAEGRSAWNRCRYTHQLREAIPYSLRLSKGRIVLPVRGRDCATQVSRRITLCSTRGYGITKNLPAILVNTMRSIYRASVLNTTQHSQQFWGSYLADRTPTYPREYINFQPSNHLARVCISPVRGVFHKPLTDNNFKTAFCQRHVCRFLRLLHCARVCTICDQLARNFARSRASDKVMSGYTPKAKTFSTPANLYFKRPVSGAVRLHQ